MIRGYNLVPWEKITFPLEEVKQLLRIIVCMDGHYKHIYIPQDHVHKKVSGINLWIGLNY
jgi:hypothetical protein